MEPEYEELLNTIENIKDKINDNDYKLLLEGLAKTRKPHICNHYNYFILEVSYISLKEKEFSRDDCSCEECCEGNSEECEFKEFNTMITNSLEKKRFTFKVLYDSEREKFIKDNMYKYRDIDFLDSFISYEMEDGSGIDGELCDLAENRMYKKIKFNGKDVLVTLPFATCMILPID